MPNGMYGGVRGKETKIGRKTISFPYLLDYLDVPSVFEFGDLKQGNLKSTLWQIYEEFLK